MELTEDLDQSSNCVSKVIVIDLRIRIFIPETCYASHSTLEKKAKI